MSTDWPDHVDEDTYRRWGKLDTRTLRSLQQAYDNSQTPYRNGVRHNALKVYVAERLLFDDEGKRNE